MDARRFEVSKADLRRTRAVDAPLPDLADGQVLFAIDCFAFTSNNVTYAAFGEAMQTRMELPGPKPTLFFAPAQIKKRVADWGGAAFQQKSAAAWRAFIARVTDPVQPWLTVERERGPEAIARTVHARR